MPRLESTGTHCCGMVSVSNFTKCETETSLRSINRFKTDVLLDLFQKYGKTEDFEFESLMEVVREVLPHHVLQAVLSDEQYYNWHTRLKKHRFRLTRKFNNPTGGICYYYLKMPRKTRRPIEKGER